jgi:hypothetical protein
MAAAGAERAMGKGASTAQAPRAEEDGVGLGCGVGPVPVIKLELAPPPPQAVTTSPQIKAADRSNRAKQCVTDLMCGVNPRYLIRATPLSSRTVAIVSYRAGRMVLNRWFAALG